MTLIADTVYERIQEVEHQRAALDNELAALMEIHEIARTRLSNGGAVASAPPVVVHNHIAPAPQKKATSSRKRATAKKTSARRRPAPPRETPGTVDRAQAPASGGRGGVTPDEIVDRVREALRELGPTTPNAIGLHLGYPKSTSGMVAVREVVAKLVGTGEAKVDGQVRGRPAYSLVDEKEPRQAPAEAARSATVPQEAHNPVDELLDRMADYLKENGPRRREDLKGELGQPFEEEFRLALDRGITLKRIQRVTQQGGRVVYRHMGGER